MKRLLLVLLALLVVGCQTVADKRKIDYRAVRTLPPLDVPPDLANPSSTDAPGSGGVNATTYSGYVGDSKPQTPGQSTVLPQFGNVKLAREGNRRWLVVSVEPTALWEPLREFVLTNGLVIDAENPAIGVIETDWAENRAKVGTGGQRLIAKWFKSFYSTGLRDKYRFRLERGATPGTTDIYLTHQGMEEFVPDRNDDSGPTGSLWRPRASDAELEIDMLQRLVTHLGGNAAVAAAQPVANEPAPATRASLARDNSGAPLLALQDTLDRAWRRVGLSLDRIGFTVEDRDRTKGIYYIRYIDPDKPRKSPGWWARTFGGKSATPRDQYQVRLEGSVEGTSIAVLSPDGAPDASKTGERILSLLYEQLK